MVENVRHRLRKNACTSMSFPVGGRGRVSTRPDRVTVCPFLRFRGLARMLLDAGTCSAKSCVAARILREPG